MSFIKDEKAQAMVEYALIAFVLALASYGAVKLFLEAWKSKFNRVKDTRTGTAGILP